MVVSQNKGPQYKPQYTIVHYYGDPPKKAPLIVRNRLCTDETARMWGVVKTMAAFWIPIRIRHLIFRVPKKGPSF